MTKTFFIIIVMFSFVVIVIGTNVYAQFDKVGEKQQASTLAVAEVNMTDEMKYRCIEMDTKGKIDQIENKEQQIQCEEFLDKVSISEIKDLIAKYKQVN